MRRRNSVSGLSAVDVLRADLDTGVDGCTIFSLSVVSALEDWPETLGSGRRVGTFSESEPLEEWKEHLRIDKHEGTLSIFGKGETGDEKGRLVSSNCLILLTL